MLARFHAELNKKALSEVIATVLFILLAIILVTIVWFSVNKLILTAPVEAKCFDLGNQFFIEKACYSNNNEIEVSIRRNIESQKINKFSLEFLPSGAIWEITGNKCLDVKSGTNKYGSYSDVVIPGSTFHYTFNVSSLSKQSSLRFAVQAGSKTCIIEDKKIVNC